MSERVAVLGASNKPDRYSYMAIEMLLEHGHTPVPVTPKNISPLGIPAVPNLASVEGKIDTLTMYVNAQLSTKLRDQILKLKPGRVIFNPGTENPALMDDLRKAGVGVLEACTLVLLSTGQY